MKKLIILIIMILTITALSSEENKEKINFYLGQLHLQKITYNGQQGYFMPFEGWTNLTHMLNDYYSYQLYYKEYQDRLQDIRRRERYNLRLRTGLGVSVSINVGFAFVAIGSGFLIYSLK